MKILFLSILHRMFSVKQSFWTTIAILLLDVSLLLFVNLDNEFNEGEYFLAIPCAVVGVIIFWVYVIRSGGKIGGSTSYHPFTAGQDDPKSKLKNESEDGFCFKWILSIFSRQKDEIMKDPNCKPIIIPSADKKYV